MINKILNVYKTLCAKLKRKLLRNIETEYSVVIPDKLKIRDFDINIVMGNLLNNAMEAMEKIKHKKFFLDISFEKNILFIHMENTYNGKEKKKGEIFLTTKSNKKIHGIGLKSIENVLEKYDGDIIYCPDKTKGVFKVDVMLCNKEIN